MLASWRTTLKKEKEKKTFRESRPNVSFTEQI
jgi:hypothetical protein